MSSLQVEEVDSPKVDSGPLVRSEVAEEVVQGFVLVLVPDHGLVRVLVDSSWVSFSDWPGQLLELAWGFWVDVVPPMV